MSDDHEPVTPQTKALGRRARAPSVLSPRNATELINYSKFMAASNMVPDSFQGDPAKIAVAIQMGAELGMTPVQALTCIAVINGMPSMYGDGLNAVLRASGELDLSFGAGGIDERPPDEALKENEGYCAIKLKGWDKPMIRRFSGDEAEVAGLIKRSQSGKGGGPWVTYKGRMLMFKSRNWCMRDGAAHILKGLQQAEILESEMLEADYSIKEPQRIVADPVEERAITDFVSGEGSTKGPKAPTRARNGGGGGKAAGPPADAKTWTGVIMKMTQQPTRNPKVTKYFVIGHDQEQFQTISHELRDKAKEFASTGEQVALTWHQTQWGKEIDAIAAAEQPPPEEFPIEPAEPGSGG